MSSCCPWCGLIRFGCCRGGSQSPDGNSPPTPTNAPTGPQYMPPPPPASTANIESASSQPAASSSGSTLASHPHTPSPPHSNTSPSPLGPKHPQTSTTPGPSSPVRYQLQDTEPKPELDELGPGLNDTLSTDPDSYDYGVHQMHGAWRQRWLDDPNAPHCSVQAPQLDFGGLISNPNPRERWIVKSTRWGAAPSISDEEIRNLGLPTGEEDYHHIRIQKPGVHRTRGTGHNDYLHYTGRGVIFVVNVERFSGPFLSEIALVKYVSDFPIDTLRYIFIQNVINDDTRSFSKTFFMRRGMFCGLMIPVTVLRISQ
jgi:hypothetical protein